MKDLLIIIQARMTSTRLPGKIMMPLGNKPVLQVMIERLADLKENIIIATTDDGSEQPIVALCQHLGVKYFQGSTDDVLGRYYLAAKHFGAIRSTAIMRLTSDCPVIDQTLVKQCISTYQNNNYDMVSLGPHSGFPRGLDSCIFHFPLLEKTHLSATTAPDREHVTLGMAKFSDLSSYVISAQTDLTQYRLTLDEQADYDMLDALYKLFNYQTSFSFEQLINVLKKHPQVAQINAHVEQKQV